MSVILLLIAVFAAGRNEATDPCPYKVNLLFIADGSETVCGDDLVKCEGWNRTLQFFHKIAESMDIGPDASRVAMIKYGSKTEKAWDFNDPRSKDKALLLAAIDSVERPRGEFDTISLVTAHQVITEEFNVLSGARLNIVNIALMLTDGMKVPILGHVVMANTLHVAGVTFLVGCVTGTSGHGDQATAESIASSPRPPNTQTYWLVDDYASLETDKVDQSASKQICLMLEACDIRLPNPFGSIQLPIPICNV